MLSKYKINEIIKIVIFLCVHFIQVFFVLWLSIYSRQLLGNAGFMKQFTIDHLNVAGYFVIFAILFILLMSYEGLYTSRNLFWEEARDIIKIVTLWIILIFAFISLTHKLYLIPRGVIIFLWLYSVILFPLCHFWTKKLLIRLGIHKAPIIIIGAGNAGRSSATGIIHHDYLGYEIVGFFDDNAKCDKIPINNRQFPILGTLKDVEEYTNFHEIWAAVVAIPTLETQKLAHLVNLLYCNVNRVIVIPNLRGIPVSNISLMYLFEQSLILLKLKNNLKFISNRILKYIFDTVLSILFLPLILLITLIIGILIKIDSPGPVFYSHPRVGKGGKIFKVYKFRTMYKDSKERLEKLLNENEELRKEWETNFKLKNDPRVTKVGKFLRKTSLDELPQIFNVLKGEMSLVGPRPVIQEEIDKYYKEYAKYYFMTSPGVTGLWQVSGRSDTNYDFRVWIDSWYVLNWSLWLDVVILFKTIKVVLKREGAY